MSTTIYLFTSLLLSVGAYRCYQPFSYNVKSQRGTKDISMKITDKDDNQNIDFNVPTRGYQSQRSMITNGKNLVGALSVASGLFLGSRKTKAFEACDCGTEGCMSPVCTTETAESQTWYNPKNERIFDTYHKSYLPARPELYLSKDRLEGKNIITIGETHTNPLCHRLELDVIRALAINNVPTGQKMAIGLECFFRQHQNALDRYVFVHHDLGILKKDTDWDKSWGYDLNFYAKIFNYASTHGIRLVGLNVPYQVAALVGEQGLDNVPKKLKKFLPEVDLKNSKHREQFEAAIGAFGGHGSMKSDAFNRMYEVQTLWDEYMAESAVMYSKEHPSELLVVIAGVGHVAGRVGIPDRIGKRLNVDPFVIVPQQVDWVATSGLPDVAMPLQIEDCDWAWYTEKELAV